VNVHDAPPRDATAPIVHDPPHDARTGTDRTGDHPIGGHSPLGNFLHHPQNSLDEFFPHSLIIFSTAHRTSRGSIGTTARSVSASGSGSRSGNPMKRAQQEAQAQQAEKARQGAAFGQQTQQQELDLADMNLPKGFEKFLK